MVKRIPRIANEIPLLGALLVLAACGGGGSGGNPPPVPAVSASPAPVAVTASVNSTAPSATVNVTFANAPAGFTFSTNDYTTKGIAKVSAPSYTATQGSFTVTFQPPNGLAPATYSDTITLLLCSDPQCKVVVVSTALPVNYTVTPPSGSSVPQVTLDSTSMTVQVLHVDNGPVMVTPDPNALTFTNFAVTPFVRVSAPTTGGLTNVQFVMSDATHGGIALSLVTPSTMAEGTYDSPIKVTVCLDPNCVNRVPSGNFTVTLHYVIGNTVTVTGPNGYMMTTWPITANDIIAGNQQSPIYVATPGAGGPGTCCGPLLALDPVSGGTTTVLPASAGADIAGLSQDERYLWVTVYPPAGEIERINTASLAIDDTIPTGQTAFCCSVATAPGTATTFAVAGNQLQIYDGTVVRPNTYSFGSTSWVTGPAYWVLGSATSTVYALVSIGAGPSNECGFGVDVNGVTSTVSCGTVDSGGFVIANGLLYRVGGDIVDPTTWKTIASFSIPNRTLDIVLPDVTLGKAFAYAYGAGGPYSASQDLLSFNLTSQAAIAGVRLPTGCCGRQLVRWGSNGLAGVGSDYVLVISGAFVGP